MHFFCVSCAVVDFLGFLLGKVLQRGNLCQHQGATAPSGVDGMHSCWWRGASPPALQAAPPRAHTHTAAAAAVRTRTLRHTLNGRAGHTHCTTSMMICLASAHARLGPQPQTVRKRSSAAPYPPLPYPVLRRRAGHLSRQLRCARAAGGRQAGCPPAGDLQRHPSSHAPCGGATAVLGAAGGRRQGAQCGKRRLPQHTQAYALPWQNLARHRAAHGSTSEFAYPAQAMLPSLPLPFIPRYCV